MKSETKHHDRDTMRGLYRKYHVTRTDGSSEDGGKHEGCDYFVLDWYHDLAALVAIEAYERTVSSTYPRLAVDLLKKRDVQTMRRTKEEKAELERMRRAAGLVR